jgi:hypothetical protein
MNNYIIIGIAVLMLCITVLQPPPPVNYPMKTSNISSRISSMLGNVSAQIAKVVTSREDDTMDAGDVYPVIKNGTVDLVDAVNAAKDPDAYKTISDENKEKNGQIVREWMKTHDNALMMFFAPWCTHCHHAMESVSKVTATKEFPCLMINAMTCPTHMMAGPKSIHELEYFPTYLIKKGTELKLSPSPESAAQELRNDDDATDNVVTARIASLDEPEVESQTPFDDLF